MLNILFIGDIVGRPGRDAVKKYLNKIIRDNNIAFTIANGENSAGGKGITPNVMVELKSYGVDVLTSGNHIWKRREVAEIIEDQSLLRPQNYPDLAPGKGWGVYEADNVKIAVINLQGRIFLEAIDCPFSAADKVLRRLKDVPVIIVDVHAEATSEKLALGWYLDGKVSAVIGTHTHIQTNDAKILPEGTAYITDIGMTGSKSGILGVEKEEIIKKFLTGMPFRSKMSKGDIYFEAAIIKIDEKTGKSTGISAISHPVKLS